jgi:hypothetical protein
MLAKSQRTVMGVAGLGLLCSCAAFPGRRGEAVVDPCSVRSAPADTTGWIRSPVYYRLLMPPGFVPDTGRLGYWHGGARWRDRNRRVLEIVNGHWGEGSFRPPGPVPSGAFAECRDVIDGERVFLTAARRHGNYPVTEGRYTVTAWFPNREGTFGGWALFGGGPRRADQEFFLALFRTIKFARDTTGR